MAFLSIAVGVITKFDQMDKKQLNKMRREIIASVIYETIADLAANFIKLAL